MRYKIVLVPFPFDDLSSQKLRPALCLTDEIPPHGHVVLAFITSKVSANPDIFDMVIDSSDSDFHQTGLKVSSTVRLHRLVTVTKKIILRQLGELPVLYQTKSSLLLRNLFDV